MKEVLELRVNYDYAHLLFKANEGKNIGTSVRVVEISTDDPRYKQIPIIEEKVRKEYNSGFFFGWQIKRRYRKEELNTAELLHLKIKTVFEPTGEECGTLYDETVACKICGTNSKQISPLILKKVSIPKKDIAKTIGGEVVVSEKFVNAVKQRKLKGLGLSPIYFGKGILSYYQLTANVEVELSSRNITGNNPFEKTTGSQGGTCYICGYEMKYEPEVYICPKGDLIGLNLLSEPYVLYGPLIKEFDFLASKQKIGVKRGLIRPESVYFCSQIFKKMVEEENLSGFEFEIAHIEQ
jgi:hypothetical protein